MPEVLWSVSAFVLLCVTAHDMDSDIHAVA
jgi:hypothetical protein